MKKVSKLLKGLSKSQKKGIAWLVDPEKETDLSRFAWVKGSGLDLILVGGSSTSSENFENTARSLGKVAGEIPVCLFPGSHLQLSRHADAILFMSLISGRNPEFLISHQVLAAPELARMDLEVLPTGYILVNQGELLSVHSVSQTLPLSNEDFEQVKATALAGKFLGMKYFYLDAGSGAGFPVSPKVISEVKSTVNLPLIVGGGLNSLEKIRTAFEAGADLIVLGNSIEKDPGFLAEVLDIKEWYNLSLNIN
ncbi:phosphoglycerol geranylgeranyltransferase [Algoriphagus sp. A40]|uniref:phosphoglycerol geranylgeranyltransferase n=1 Tax=Algoriphagus sp. A40 TaxID=1945863 RepID=UPI0009CB5804|nr:phosphoglycerol geranylgeranyltransferase [Algoriphagus sp. A40]OOG78887.1 phosphoglycerol geranylgeranyltransferase [Algoriphagus sp. A40]